MQHSVTRYEKRGHVAYITMNRPEVLNAQDAALNREMNEIVDDFVNDPELYVAILTGAGDRGFCAGADLKAVADGRLVGSARELAVPDRGFNGLTEAWDLFKPVIAAVNGYAVGGGLETVMACDIVIAAEHAKLGLPEPRRGIIAGAGGVHRLPRQVPLKQAMGMILTGEPISAQEALRIGLVNEVVPFSQLMETAEKWARRILECAPLAVQASKQAAMANLHLSLQDAMAIRQALQGRLHEGPDAIEGPAAFAQKRKPVWVGR
jgi:enoyl-CoA hydratase/carnithine racemase